MREQGSVRCFGIWLQDYSLQLDISQKVVDVNKNSIPMLCGPRSFLPVICAFLSQDRGMPQCAFCLADDSRLVLLEVGAAVGYLHICGALVVKCNLLHPRPRAATY